MTMKLRLFFGMSLAMLMLAGCTEKYDTRTTDEKREAPQPDFKTRLYMACPKCGCPQRPYRISEIKDYYRCSGGPPKFPYHPEHQWQHEVNRCPAKRVEM